MEESDEEGEDEEKEMTSCRKSDSELTLSTTSMSVHDNVDDVDRINGNHSRKRKHVSKIC
jgi:hypothetical protein